VAITTSENKKVVPKSGRAPPPHHHHHHRHRLPSAAAATLSSFPSSSSTPATTAAGWVGGIELKTTVQKGLKISVRQNCKVRIPDFLSEMRTKCDGFTGFFNKIAQSCPDFSGFSYKTLEAGFRIFAPDPDKILSGAGHY
jgi:hypothetical protein